LADLFIAVFPMKKERHLMDINPGSESFAQSHPHAHADKLLEHVHFPTFKHEHAPIVNVNEVIDEKLTIGQKVADAVAANMGSWRFIIIQSILLTLWIILNTIGWIKHWDSYPFILLNLALSFQAAYAAPFIMISQNRQAEKDRITAQNDYITDTKGEQEVCHMMEHLDHQDTLTLQIVQRLAEQEKLTLGIVQRLEAQNERMKGQHEEMMVHLRRLDPALAEKLGDDAQQGAVEQEEKKAE
jgi:uncharacterized membrane protein